MKLHTSLGTNPNVVRLFVAAKDLDIATVEVDLASGAHKRAPYLALNPLGQVPVLELADGTAISQTSAICEYLEEIEPDPPLIGATPEQRAETRMWVRRIDLMIAEPMTLAFKGSEGFMFFQHATRCLPEAADGLKALVQDNLTWLDAQIEGRDTICPGRFTLADIILFAFVTFGNTMGAQPLSPDFRNLNRWFATATERLAQEQSHGNA